VFALVCLSICLCNTRQYRRRPPLTAADLANIVGVATTVAPVPPLAISTATILVQRVAPRISCTAHRNTIPTSYYSFVPLNSARCDETAQIQQCKHAGPQRHQWSTKTIIPAEHGRCVLYPRRPYDVRVRAVIDSASAAERSSTIVSLYRSLSRALGDFCAKRTIQKNTTLPDTVVAIGGAGSRFRRVFTKHYCTSSRNTYCCRRASRQTQRGGEDAPDTPRYPVDVVCVSPRHRRPPWRPCATRYVCKCRE